MGYAACGKIQGVCGRPFVQTGCFWQRLPKQREVPIVRNETHPCASPFTSCPLYLKPSWGFVKEPWPLWGRGVAGLADLTCSCALPLSRARAVECGIGTKREYARSMPAGVFRVHCHCRWARSSRCKKGRTLRILQLTVRLPNGRENHASRNVMCSAVVPNGQQLALRCSISRTGPQLGLADHKTLP